MKGVRAQCDEKWEQAVAVVSEVDGFPMEDAAIGAFARAVIRSLEGDLIFAEPLGCRGDVAGMNGPADEARIGHLTNLRQADDVLLLGVRRHDFQVSALAARHKSVAG